VTGVSVTVMNHLWAPKTRATWTAAPLTIGCPAHSACQAWDDLRPHRALNQAAPLRPLPDGVTDLDRFRALRRNRAGGVIHEYRLVA
jgi:hypothetical protein